MTSQTEYIARAMIQAAYAQPNQQVVHSFHEGASLIREAVEDMEESAQAVRMYFDCLWSTIKRDADTGNMSRETYGIAETALQVVLAGITLAGRVMRFESAVLNEPDGPMSVNVTETPTGLIIELVDADLLRAAQATAGGEHNTEGGHEH